MSMEPGCQPLRPSAAPAIPRHITPELLQPDRRLRIARRAPVAAGREGAARADLRRVGHRGALELAQLEEAVEENSQPLLDAGQVVLVPPLDRNKVGPGAAL